MKKLFIVFIVFLLFLLSIPSSVNAMVTSTPASFDLELNGTDNKTIEFTLINYQNITFTDCFFNATYTSNFSLPAVLLNPITPVDLTAVVYSPGEPGEYEDEIVMSCYVNTTLGPIISIPIKITVPSPRAYLFKKCFYEEEQEYCTELDLEQIQNITIINKTENVTVANFMLDFNLTREFFDFIILGMKNVTTNIQEASEEIKSAQEKERDVYMNAMALENFLKNPGNPTWTQIMPTNVLRNTTGMSNEQLWSALNILYPSNKVIQKTVREDVTYPMSGGILMQQRDVVYIASGDRVQSEANAVLRNNVIFFLIFVIAVIFILFVFNKKVLKRRVKF